MTPAARDRTRWQHRAFDSDGRARRAVEAQQAAYEASRAVLAAAARRRDAAWRHAAHASRRRAIIALVAPLAVAIVLCVLGVVSTDFLIAGVVIACAVTLVSWLTWARSTSVLTKRLGGTVVTAKRRPSILGAAEAARLVDVAEGLFAVFGLPRRSGFSTTQRRTRCRWAARPTTASCSSPVASSFSWTGSSWRPCWHTSLRT